MGKVVFGFIFGAALATGLSTAIAAKPTAQGSVCLAPEKRIEAVPGNPAAGVGTLYEVQGGVCDGEKCGVNSVMRCRDAALARCYNLLSGYALEGKSQHPSACK